MADELEVEFVEGTKTNLDDLLSDLLFSETLFYDFKNLVSITSAQMGSLHHDLKYQIS